MKAGYSKVLIVEDEPLIQEHLSACLNEIGYKVVGMIDSVNEAIDFLKKNHNDVDIVLLDINLNDELDGIDLANIIKNEYGMPFMFVTSYTDDKTIERAKHTGPIGYIVKPFTTEDLKSNLEIALFNYRKEIQESITSDFIYVKKDHELKKLSFSEITYLEANDNYCMVYTEDGRYLLSKTLKKTIVKFPPSKFIRVHRSYVINVDQIDSIGPNYIKIKGKEIPLSESSRKELMQQIETL
ncbi:MAG: response regulator [Crocinitomicaceae bacterium]|nr:response regulator [Crocinitomicaceae bacterium]